jgi:hypothetical protein
MPATALALQQDPAHNVSRPITQAKHSLTDRKNKWHFYAGVRGSAAPGKHASLSAPFHK